MNQNSPASVKPLVARIPGLAGLLSLPRQLLRLSPFQGDIHPTRVPLFWPGSQRPTLPFPHPWNYQQPLEMLESYFWNAERETGSGKHNRYLEVPLFSPIFVTRDPQVIRAIATETGDAEGQFDRDTLPSTGIARATGKDTLLFSNRGSWRRQRQLAAAPFGKTALFQPEIFQEFADTLRTTVRARLSLLREHLQNSGSNSIQLTLEPEIKAIMLELLVSNFFGANIPYSELRETCVPALERVIEHIVRDTVTNRLGIPIWQWPSVTTGIARIKEDYACFERLTDAVLVPRKDGGGLWRHFKSDAPDELIRSNLKVFLAGALEATTSLTCWTLTHLARDIAAQQRVYDEVRPIDHYTPEAFQRAPYLQQVLDETLRLTPSLYFLPRRASQDTWLTTSDGRRLFLPSGTHILLDVWHANRHEDHWGQIATGHPALDFVPERWAGIARGGRSKDFLHFGFGHGARVCPGKHLALLEVALVVGVFVKIFEFSATSSTYTAKAGVSTKPADGTLLNLRLRESD